MPILGILCCLLLMFSLPADNWWRLVGWLAVGLAIYFGYGRRHSIVHELQERRPAGGAAEPSPD